MGLEESIIQYLEAKDIQYHIKEEKILSQCINPAHIDKNPSAFFDTNVQFFHCSSCGFHLNRKQLLEILGFDEIKESDLKKFEFRKQIQKRQVIVENAPLNLPVKYKDFTNEYRGISRETFQKTSAYFTQSGNFFEKRIIFPIKDLYGEVKGFEAVAVGNTHIEKKLPKVMRNKKFNATLMFGFEDLIKDDILFITEGVFSALSFIELGYNAVYNFGVGSIKQKLDSLKIKNIKKVILCGDKDEKGKEFNKANWKLLHEIGIKVRFFRYRELDPLKTDANDILKISREGLHYVIKNNLRRF